METQCDIRDGKFPASLLIAPEIERKLYFKQYIMKHPFICDAVDSAYSMLASLVSERIIFVCGPSGVGKSEFIQMLKEKITSQADIKSLNRRGVVPVVDVEASAPVKSGFNFDLLWMSVLEKLREPLIDKKNFIPGT